MVSHVGTTTWVSGTGSVTPTIPTGTTTGDVMIMTLVSKYDDAVLASDPTGWTSLGSVANTGRSTGNDNGNLRGRAFYRAWQSGDSAPTLTPSPNNVSTVTITTYRPAASMALQVTGELCKDDTVGTPLVLTATSTLNVVGSASGCIFHTDLVINGDAPTWGTSTLTITGATFGASSTNTADANTTSGTDLRMRSLRYAVTAGTASANPSISTALAGTTTNAVGVGLLASIRDVNPPVVISATTVSRSVAITGHTVFAGVSATANPGAVAPNAAAIPAPAVGDGNVTTTNVLPNPSAEDGSGTTGWSSSSTTTTFEASAQSGAPDGPNVFRLVAVGGNMQMLSSSISPATPGSVWSARYRIKQISGSARTCRVDIQFLNDSNTVLDSFNSGNHTTTTSWAEVTNETTATGPTGTTRVRVRCIVISAAASEEYHLDAVQLEQSASVPAYNPVHGAAATPVLAWPWVGAVTSSGCTIVTKTTNNGSDTPLIRYSVNSDMSGSTDTSPATLVGDGTIAKHTLTGLSANTRYYYKVVVGSTVLNAGDFYTAPSSQTSFDFAFGSCRATNSDSLAFSDMVTRGAKFLLHLGDWHYEDIGAETANLYRAGLNSSFLQVNFNAMSKKMMIDYVFDDHDSSGNGAMEGEAGMATAQSIYREVAPYYTLPQSPGLEHTFVWGRVRFIILDCRSYRDAPGIANSSTKTMLGTTQKAWLKNLLETSTEPALVVASSVPWVGGDEGSADHWGKYPDERTELAPYFSAVADRCVIISGDMHALAYDDGTNSAGGVQVWHGAPFAQTNSVKGGPYSGGTSVASTNQYGFVNVVDSGSQIVMTYNGINAAAGTTWGTIDLTINAGAATVEPATISRTASFGSPTLIAGTGAGLTANVIELGGTAVVDIPAPTVAAGAGPVNVNTITVDAVTIAAGTAVAANTTVTAASISRTVAVDAPTLAAGSGANVAATVVTVANSVGTPTLIAGTSADVTATTVTRSAAVDATTTSASATVTATNVSCVGTVGTATTSSGSGTDVAATSVSRAVIVAAPTLLAGSGASITAAIVSLASSFGTHVLQIHTTSAPVVLAGVGTVPTATVLAGTQAAITGATVVGTASFGTPTFVANAGVVPNNIGVVASIGSAAVQAGGGVTAQPATVAVLSQVSAPTLSGGSAADVSPSTLSRGVVVGSVSTSAAAVVVASSVSRIASIGSFTATAAAVSTPSAVSRVVAIGSPAIVAGTQGAITATTVSRTASFVAPSIIAGESATVEAETVSRFVFVPTVTVSGVTNASATTASRTVNIGTPTVNAGSQTSANPGTVSCASTISTPTLGMGITIAATTVVRPATVSTPAILANAVTNKLSNPSFEGGAAFTNWTNSGTASSATIQTISGGPDGPSVAQLVAAGGVGGVAANLQLMQTEVVPAAPGDVWSAGISIRQMTGADEYTDVYSDTYGSSAPARTMRADIQFLNSSNAIIAGTGSPQGGTWHSTTLSSTSSWQRVVNESMLAAGATNGVAPAGTTRVRLRTMVLSALAGETFQYDAAQLEKTGTLPAYNPAYDMEDSVVAATTVSGSTTFGSQVVSTGEANAGVAPTTIATVTSLGTGSAADDYTYEYPGTYGGAGFTVRAGATFVAAAVAVGIAMAGPTISLQTDVNISAGTVSRSVVVPSTVASTPSGPQAATVSSAAIVATPAIVATRFITALPDTVYGFTTITEGVSFSFAREPLADIDGPIATTADFEGVEATLAQFYDDPFDSDTFEALASIETPEAYADIEAGDTLADIVEADFFADIN
jgi:hypothetical protein